MSLEISKKQQQHIVCLIIHMEISMKLTFIIAVWLLHNKKKQKKYSALYDIISEWCDVLLPLISLFLLFQVRNPLFSDKTSGEYLLYIF